MHPYRRSPSIAKSMSTRTLDSSRTSKATPSVAPTRQRPATGVSRIGGSQNITCALIESRGIAATIGLCFVNLSTGKGSQVLFQYTLTNTDKGECALSEICDSQQYVRTLHKLHVYDPTEVMRL